MNSVYLLLVKNCVSKTRFCVLENRDCISDKSVFRTARKVFSWCFPRCTAADDVRANFWQFRTISSSSFLN